MHSGIRPVYSDVAKGVDLLWNNQIKDAEAFFQKGKNSHPRYALHYAEVRTFEISHEHTHSHAYRTHVYTHLQDQHWNMLTHAHTHLIVTNVYRFLCASHLLLKVDKIVWKEFRECLTVLDLQRSS